MTILIEPRHSHEFIVSEADKTRSREEVSVLAPSGGLEPGTVMGKVGANYVTLDLGAATGAEVVSGILLNPASEGTDSNVIIARSAEVAQGALTYPTGASGANIITINTALEGLGIIVRASGVEVA